MAPLSQVHTFPPTPLASTRSLTTTPVTERGTEAERVEATWFPVAPDSAGQARTFLVDVCTASAVDPDVAADAVLTVSELVSNVVQHTRSRSVGVEVHLTRAGRLTPGVQAEAAALPATTSERGRGLAILDALAHQWGITRTHRTTATWFTLVPAQPPSVPDPHDARPERADSKLPSGGWV